MELKAFSRNSQVRKLFAARRPALRRVHSRRSRADSAEVTTVVAGVLVTPKVRQCVSSALWESSSFRSWRSHFPRNLESDFTHYRSAEPLGEGRNRLEAGP